MTACDRRTDRQTYRHELSTRKRVLITNKLVTELMRVRPSCKLQFAHTLNWCVKSFKKGIKYKIRWLQKFVKIRHFLQFIKFEFWNYAIRLGVVIFRRGGISTGVFRALSLQTPVPLILPYLILHSISRGIITVKPVAWVDWPVHGHVAMATWAGEATAAAITRVDVDVVRVKS